MSMQTSGQDPGKTWAIIVWVLYLLGYFTLITVVVGLIIAYLKRDELAGTVYQSHMTSAIRTFWIGLIVGMIGLALAFAGIGIIVLIALVAWQLFCILRGLIRAIDGRAINDPSGWR